MKQFSNNQRIRSRHMDVKKILTTVEKSLQNTQEHEYFLIHSARYQRILEEITLLTQNNNKKLRILDVGCYPYHLGAALELMGHDVYGIASSHEPIHSPKIKVCNIETDKFPFKDNFFDLVIFTEVLEHLPQSPTLAIRQMQRVTKTQGKLLITTPNIARSINRGKLLLGKSVTYPLSQAMENNGKGSIIYHRHNREYTLSELVSIVKHAGWNIQNASYFVSYTPTRRRARPDSLPMKLGKWANYLLMLGVPSLADTLLVIGSKS